MTNTVNVEARYGVRYPGSAEQGFAFFRFEVDALAFRDMLRADPIEENTLYEAINLKTGEAIEHLWMEN